MVGTQIQALTPGQASRYFFGASEQPTYGFCASIAKRLMLHSGSDYLFAKSVQNHNNDHHIC